MGCRGGDCAAHRCRGADMARRGADTCRPPPPEGAERGAEAIFHECEPSAEDAADTDSGAREAVASAEGGEGR